MRSKDNADELQQRILALKAAPPQLASACTVDSLPDRENVAAAMTVFGTWCLQSWILHAGEAETSMMMRLTPELVDDSDLASHRTAGDLSFLLAGQASFRWRDLASVTPNGVLGDPSTASADKGEQLLEAASDAISELIRDPDTWSAAPDIRSDHTGGVPFVL